MFKFWWRSLFQRDFESVTDFVHKVSLLHLEGAGGCKSVIPCVDVFCSSVNPEILYYFCMPVSNTMGIIKARCRFLHALK